MRTGLLEYLREETDALDRAGLFKAERIISTPQGAGIEVAEPPAGQIINFCANNYLGLSNHPAIVAAAKAALDIYGAEETPRGLVNRVKLYAR